MPIIAWLVSKFTGEAIKAGGEVAKTATEIPKNIVETRKAHLEVAELQRQREEREHLITPATFADVERYDPKIKQIAKRSEDWLGYALAVLLIAFALVAGVDNLAKDINASFEKIGTSLAPSE